ncbi:MAG: hypothetical protein AAGJ32_04190 [Pseudomonadota bacterium]
MKLSAIRLRNIRGFGPEGLAIEHIPDGLSVLARPNEFGKSTLFDALRLVFGTKHSAGGLAVKALVPWANTGTPEVEVDIHAAGRTFRVSKRYLKGKSAQVTDLVSGDIVAKGSDADAWLMDASGVSSGTGGPTGFLWVKQGRSMEQPAGGEPVLSQLLEQEVGLLVGGEAARSVLERAIGERAKWLTGKTRKPTGRYKEALEARAPTQDKLSTLKARQIKAENALSELQTLKRQITKQSDPERDREFKQKRDQAADELEAAKQAANELQILEQKTEFASTNLDHARSTEKHHADKVKEADRLAIAIKQSSGHAAELSRSHAEFSKTLSVAENELIEAEDVWKTIAQRNRARETFENALRAHNTLEQLENKRDQARALDDALRARAKAIAQNRATETAYNTAADCDRNVSLAKARIEGGRPTIHFDLTADGTDSVRLNETPVRNGQTESLSGTSVIDLGHLGAITISATDHGEARDALENAELALQNALEELGVRDVAEAEAKARERIDLQRASQHDRQRLEQLAPDGLEALDQEIAVLRTQLPEDFDPDTPPPPPVDIAEAEAAVEKARATAENYREAHADAEKEWIKHRTRTSMNEDALANIDKELGEAEARSQKAIQLAEHVEANWKTLEALNTELETKRSALPNLDMCTENVARMNRAFEANQQGLQKLKIERARLEAEIDAAGADGIGEALNEVNADLARLDRRIGRYEADIRALDRLIDALSDAQARLQEAYFKPVTDAMQPLLREVVGPGTVRLGVDFQADSLRRGDFREAIDTLSGGTREQISVLSRLAFGRLMAQRGTPIPVILDDALVYCDDDRLDAMFTALNVAAKDVQCIVLTCHQRAFSQLGGEPLDPQRWKKP